jgi:hypothetical protein
MQRTLPASEQILQVDSRIRELKENVVGNIKDSLILRSNFTTMMHTSKEANENLKTEVLGVLDELRSELKQSLLVQEDTSKEIEKELVSLNAEKRYVNDGILLLEQRITEVEAEVGHLHFPSTEEFDENDS